MSSVARALSGALVPLLVLTVACKTDNRTADSAAAVSDTSANFQATPATASKVATTEGFKTPESVKYDADQDVWYVSNINGNPGAKDGNGYISRLKADGSADSLMFIAGGRGGAQLNAPKGMAIRGDTLWVTDIDAVRAFNKRTGAPIASVSLASQRAKFLNDIAVGPDGMLYITDTGLGVSAKGEMSHPGPDRVFTVGADRKVAIAIEGDSSLAAPNGIAWDGANQRFIIVPFNGSSLLSWKPGAKSATSFGSGPGQYDGVEVLPDGRILVSSWADSAIYSFGKDNAGVRVISGIASPADIGYDPKSGVVAVPSFMGNRVELWKVGGR